MTISHWPGRRWMAALLGAGAVAVAVGVPTGIIRTPLYHRMTPVLWWNYPVWVVTALFGGLILATYVQAGGGPGRPRAASGLGGGVLSFFAVGCPVCNKIVVALIGVSGALNVWAPIQPALGIVSVALLAWALRRRLAGERACPAGASGPAGQR